MTYRRDVQREEQIPLPIETVYNSREDAITCINENGEEEYFMNGKEHFNRIYFRYPPEWKTSDVGEKIIGVRNMKISIRQCMRLSFVLYIRKYRKDKFDELADTLFDDYDIIENLDDEHIQTVINRMERDDCKVFAIDYCHDICENLNEFIESVYERIDAYSVYNKLHDAIYYSDQSKDEKIAALEQLNKDKDDIYLICLRNDIPITIYKNNVDIYENYDDGKTMLTFTSRHDEHFYYDFAMTDDNDNTTYKKFYMWDDDNDEPLPYAVEYPGELDLNEDNEDNDRFDFDTACYFHIGDNNPYHNDIRYVTKFHRRLVFNHILTNLQCEVAASFANQSNHNLIGRTNEIYTPIKYYKLNDNDDKFWIELYDRNEIDIPVAFEDFFVFTMDVVFLQNRKLIYT